MGTNQYAEDELVRAAVGNASTKVWIVEVLRGRSRSDDNYYPVAVFPTEAYAQRALARIEARWNQSRRMEAFFNQRYATQGIPWPKAENQRPLENWSFRVTAARWGGPLLQSQPDEHEGRDDGPGDAG